MIPREPRYLAGFTAIGIVVLAALAYSIRIAIDPVAGSILLTAIFLLSNIAGWWLGSVLRTREPRSIPGLFLVLLGDAIFPLNLFAPMMLFTPGLRGDVPASATAVVLIGIAYHLWNYRHRARARFALPFYSYFFAVMGCAALVLTRFTAGLPLWIVAGLVLLYAIAFDELSLRRRPEPAAHFAIAAAVILGGSIVVSAIAFADRNPAALAAMVIGTVVLIASAIRARRDEAVARAHGLAAWIGITLTFTAGLYAMHSPWWAYIVATGTWTLLLAAVSMLPVRDWAEPFRESAWWAVMLLATALAGMLWKVWLPFLVGTLAAHPLRDAATVGLLLAGLALALVSFWRRRYPTIAATLRGFVANNVLLRLTSYAAPLVLIVAVTGAWPLFGAPAPANVYALLAAGMLLLIAGPRLERVYSAEALDFAGVLAMLFSAFNALSSAALSAAVLFAAAAILLVRYVRGASRWTFAASLVLTIGGLALQPIGTPRATVTFAVAAAVLAWGSTRVGSVLSRIGFWTAHAAGFVGWLSLARTLSLGRAYDALILATWAWFAFVALRLARGRSARTSYQATLVLLAASLVTMLVEPTAPRVMLVALLTAGALLFELRHVHYAGFALLGIAIVLAANRKDVPWLVAVLAVSAAVLLWQSLVRRSSFSHLLFLGAATAAAYFAMPDRGALQVLPFAILVAVCLVIELIALKLLASSSFHADLTSVIALVLAVTILAAEVASARFSIYVLAMLLLSLVAIRPWIAASEVHRVQPAAHAAFRAVGAIAGAIVVVAAARLAGLTAGQQIFALACCGGVVLAWLLRATEKRAIAAALHIIGAGVFVSALIVRDGDPFLLFACIVMAGVYFVWRAASKLTVLEHFGAFALVEAVWLFGIARHVAWPEYYLFAAAAYLCIVLVRQTALRVQNVIAVSVIATAVASPYYMLLRTASQEHLAFLGIAGVAVIHVLLTSRRHALMVFAVCAMLGLGMLFGAVVLPGDVRLNMLMAFVGFLVIADLGLIGARSDRKPLVGEIDYDHNRVTR